LNEVFKVFFHSSLEQQGTARKEVKKFIHSRDSFWEITPTRVWWHSSSIKDWSFSFCSESSL
jgi:hypothetical protein